MTRRKARIDRDSEDWNQVQQAFWFVLTSLSLIPKFLNDYKMI